MRRDWLHDALFVGAALSVAYLLKRHYSAASPDALRWVLAPTAALVELVTGVRFVAEAGAGFLSVERSFLIAPSCAGVNFLIAAFLSGCLGLHRMTSGAAQKALLLAGSLVVSYGATLLTNTARISIALALRGRALWLSAESEHRLLGGAVYCACLFAMFLFAHRVVAGARSGA